MPALGAWSVVAGMACAVGLHWLLPPALVRLGLVRSNFRGDRVPLAYGLLPVLSCLVMLAPAEPGRAVPPAALALSAYACLGLLDDALRQTGPKGLRGHLRALVRERRITTGLAKLVGGLAAGQAIAALALRSPWPMAALDGVIIALAANGLNLLDLRPGRASCAWGLLFAVVCIWAHAGGTVAWLAGPVAVMALRDARGRAMLGDTGSNGLGALLATLWLGAGPSAGARVAAAAGLAAFHLAAERWSLSSVIERYAWLRRLDRLTGVR